MAITSLTTDWGTSPRTIRMTTTNSLAEITTLGYFTSQSTVIDLLNHGAWTWIDGDFIEIVYSDGQGFFTYDAATDALIAQPASSGTLTNTLASARVFVGNASNIATGVAMSGDTTITNAGVVAIGANKVLSSMVSPLLVKYVAVPISASEFNGMYAAPKLLIAAGGANTLVVLKQAQLLLTYGSAAYAAGGTAAIQWDATVNGAGVIASTTLANTLFQGTASIGLNLNPGVVTETFSTCVNKGLYLSNISGAYTTGDSDMVLHLWYTVIPTV
ncbi:hypothetical protein [Thiocapsa sp. N5-Cardenillas]|uniref:hypothetical protein n=1 Tax=Thiocapsa sp. N5-Cardenillas TaxID=3137397 RepID=UPI0035B4021B